MPGLAGVVGFVRPHFAAPGVGADGSDLFLVDPLGGFKGEAGRVAAGITAPFAAVQTLFHLAGAHNHKVAALDFNALRFGAGIEVVVGNGGAVFEEGFADVARHVEQHAAADHAVFHHVNAVFLRAVRIDEACVVTVPHFVVVEDVAERVPLRAALQRQRHHVVGVAQAALVLIAGDGVGAGGQHGVNRIEAVAPEAFLRAEFVEVKSERKRLAAFDQLAGVDDVFGLDVVERAGFVVRAPFAPVFAFLGSGAQMFNVEFFGVVAAWHGGSSWVVCLV